MGIILPRPVGVRLHGRLSSNVRAQKDKLCAVHPSAKLSSKPLPVPVIQVKVKPNARASSLEALQDGTFVAMLKAPPVDGKANAELVSLVARHFGTSKSAVSIKAGAGARLKLVSVTAP
jgi:uncharacterized protein YggU (UPF0235/DUF167 family)